MKYYKISNSINIKEVGKYDQSESAHNIIPFWKDIENGILNESMSVPEPIVHSKAKLTSYLTSVPINQSKFLIIRKEFTDFLRGFDIIEYHTWSIKIHQNEQILNHYNLFYLKVPIQNQIIDFKKSDFLVGRLGDWRDKSIRKPISLDNYKQYDDLIKKLRKSEDRSQIRCDKLVFDFSNIKWDMFRLTNMPYLGAGYYVSEKLKEGIEKEGFTGMSFKELHEVDNRIEAIY